MQVKDSDFSNFLMLGANLMLVPRDTLHAHNVHSEAYAKGPKKYKQKITRRVQFSLDTLPSHL